uniref:N(6)-L-threonylcarbamoyladenine synthase n=1 Tax=Panagrolaimus sp. ES5 TaxID=591445 RepID=A0AC34FBC9_9BILA
MDPTKYTQKIIGIEGSANKVGVGIVTEMELIANTRATFHGEAGEGFRPTEVARHHQKILPDLIADAFEQAGIKDGSEVAAIAYTKGPGMGAPLQAGAVAAQALAMTLGIPMVPVNHCVAHVEMGRSITQTRNPIVLYVSGGNTQILNYCRKKYYILGETLDIAVGNCFDRLARVLKLPNEPSPGYSVEQLAKQGTKLFPLSYSVKGMDMAFSGILTQITKQGKALMAQKDTKYSAADLCMSLQETVFAMLIETTERAMSVANIAEVLIVGGVGCNMRLQQMMQLMCDDRSARLGATDARYCIDNGAMVAHTAVLMYKNGVYTNPYHGCEYTQRYRTDDVEVLWRKGEQLPNV